MSSSIPRGWGIPASDGVRFHWSARAIFRDGVLDLVWDRQGFEGTATDHEKTALSNWLNTKALPWLRACAKHGEDFPSEDESREITVSGDGYVLRADPRSTCGYLYMSACVCPSATQPTPIYDVPRAAKKRARSYA